MRSPREKEERVRHLRRMRVDLEAKRLQLVKDHTHIMTAIRIIDEELSELGATE